MNEKFFFFSFLSSKKVESEGGASAAKKDSKRKREPSVSDDVEVKSAPPSAPEDDDDDGVQVGDAYAECSSFEACFNFPGAYKNSTKYSKDQLILDCCVVPGNPAKKMGGRETFAHPCVTACRDRRR